MVLSVESAGHLNEHEWRNIEVTDWGMNAGTEKPNFTEVAGHEFREYKIDCMISSKCSIP